MGSWAEIRLFSRRAEFRVDRVIRRFCSRGVLPSLGFLAAACLPAPCVLPQVVLVSSGCRRCRLFSDVLTDRAYSKPVVCLRSSGLFIPSFCIVFLAGGRKSEAQSRGWWAGKGGRTEGNNTYFEF